MLDEVRLMDGIRRGEVHGDEMESVIVGKG